MHTFTPSSSSSSSFFSLLFLLYMCSRIHFVSFLPGDTSNEKKQDRDRKSSLVMWNRDLENPEQPTFEVSSGRRTITNVPSLFLFSCFFLTLSLSLFLFFSLCLSYFFLPLPFLFVLTSFSITLFLH